MTDEIRSIPEQAEDQMGNCIKFGALKHLLKAEGKDKTPEGHFLLMAITSFLEDHPSFSPLKDFMEFLMAAVRGSLHSDKQEAMFLSCISQVSEFAGRSLVMRRETRDSTEGRDDRIVKMQDDVENQLHAMLKPADGGTTPPSASTPQ
jgi:hypothetical protein